jgi:hypothetical protein
MQLNDTAQANRKTSTWCVCTYRHSHCLIYLHRTALQYGNNFLNGCRLPDQKLRSHWPRQPTTTVSQRRLWRKSITSTYISYDRKWRNPLGTCDPQHRPQSSATPSIVPNPLKNPGHKCASLKEYISRLPGWHKRLLSRWTQQDATDFQIWRSFRSRQRLTIASDGGLKQRLGTQGWKIVRTGRTHSSTDVSFISRKLLGIKPQMSLQVAH